MMNTLIYNLGMILMILGSSSCNDKIIEQAQDPKLSVEERIRIMTKPWMGVPYQWGGESQKGVDCSALTRMIFKDEFDIDLPRTVRDQQTHGTKVQRDSLIAGDLLIFKTGGLLSNKMHAGVYLSNGDFVHAGVSTGVTISNLSEGFWQKKFRMGRRLIDRDGVVLGKDVSSMQNSLVSSVQ